MRKIIEITEINFIKYLFYVTFLNSFNLNISYLVRLFGTFHINISPVRQVGSVMPNISIFEARW